MKKLLVILAAITLVLGLTTETKAQTVVEWMTLSILPGLSSGDFTPATGALGSFLHSIGVAGNATASSQLEQRSSHNLNASLAREGAFSSASAATRYDTFKARTPKAAFFMRH